MTEVVRVGRPEAHQPLHSGLPPTEVRPWVRWRDGTFSTSSALQTTVWCHFVDVDDEP